MTEIGALFGAHAELVQETRNQCESAISRFASLCKDTIGNGHTIYLIGNGGSACDCQHFAAELVGRFQKERQAMAAVALTTDTSILTALANDYSYDVVFSRQIEALIKPGDLLVAISTSGNSPSVLKGIDAAKDRGAAVVGLSGKSGGKMKEKCDVCICVPSAVTARIQEMHLLIEHIVCQIIEE